MRIRHKISKTGEGLKSGGTFYIQSSVFNIDHCGWEWPEAKDGNRSRKAMMNNEY
jgi:hypothetical protein